MTDTNQANVQSFSDPVAVPTETLAVETVAQMQARMVELNKKLEAARKSEFKDAMKRIKAEMIAFGIDSITITDEDKAGKPAHAGSGVKVAPKWKDPASIKTWTGRGKTPLWFNEATAIKL